MSSARRILSASALTTALTILARGLGFLVLVAVSAVFGAGPQTDAYFLAAGIPVLLVQIVGQGLNSGMVPVATRIALHRPEAMAAFAGASVLWAGIALLVFAAAFWGAAPALPAAVGFDTNPILLTSLCRALSPLVVLVGLSWLWSAFFSAERSFAWPAVAPAIKAVTLVGLLLLVRDRLGISALAWSTVAGEGAALAFLVAVHRWRGGRVRPSWRLTPEHREAARQVLAVAAGSAFFLVMPLLDRVMSARLGAGSISALEYADRIYLIPLTLAGAGLLRVLLAHWSEDHARGDLAAVRRSLIDLQGPMALLFVPLAVFLVVYRADAVDLVFVRGAFTRADAAATSTVLGWLMAGYLAHVWWVVLYQFLTAVGRTRVLVLSGLLALAAKVAANLVLGGAFGVAGIAASTALVHFGTALLLTSHVRGVLGGSTVRENIGSYLVRVGGAAAAAAVGVDLCLQAAGATAPLVRLLAAGAIGAPAYLGLLLLLGVRDAERVVGEIRGHRWVRGAFGGSR